MLQGFHKKYYYNHRLGIGLPDRLFKVCMYSSHGNKLCTLHSFICVQYCTLFLLPISTLIIDNKFISNNFLEN
jgi:hypothetical protein